MRSNQNRLSNLGGFFREKWISMGRRKVFVWVLVGLVALSSLSLFVDHETMEDFATNFDSIVSLRNRRRTEDLEFSIPSDPSSKTKPEEISTSSVPKSETKLTSNSFTLNQKEERPTTPPEENSGSKEEASLAPIKETIVSDDPPPKKGVDLIPTDLGTVAIVTLTGVQDDMGRNEAQVFESALFFYLNGIMSEHMIQIQSVTIHRIYNKAKSPVANQGGSSQTSSASNGEVPSLEIMTPRGESTTPSNRLLTHGDIQDNNDPENQRRVQTDAGQLKISLFIRGKYFPPPYIDFNQEIKYRINHGGERIVSNLVKKKRDFPFFQSISSISCTETKNLPINQVDQSMMDEFNSGSKVQIISPTVTFQDKMNSVEIDSIEIPENVNDKQPNNSKNRKNYMDSSKYAKANPNPESPANQTRLISGGIFLGLVAIVGALNILSKAKKLPEKKKQRMIDAKKGYNAANDIAYRRSSSGSTGTLRTNSIGHSSSSYFGNSESLGSSGIMDIRS